MYAPAAFAESRPEVLHALMRRHPLATLVRHCPTDGLLADAVPLLLEADTGPQGRLLGHVARGNPLWRAAQAAAAAGQAAPEVLVLFQGPQAYVSPNWYPTKAEHGKAVPTWNYAVVQAHGTLHVHTDAAWLRALLGRLTAEHEAAQARPWTLDEAPADYLSQMLGAVVGIEIHITRLAGKWKVSQNQPAVNQAGVVAGLAATGLAGDADMAALVTQMASPADALGASPKAGSVR
jgi:transcriptional regulator